MTSGFLRTGTETVSLPRAAAGPPWSREQSDLRAHEFFAVLAAGRVVEAIDDPVEHVRANALMLLFSADAAVAFESLLVRMPEPRQADWRDLIAGGARSEAFGPLTLRERLDERQVEQTLLAGRKQRIVNLVVAAVLVTVLGGGIVFGWQELSSRGERTRGALQFEATSETPSIAAEAGGPPVAEPGLSAAISEPVSLVAGTGPIAERVTTAPFARFPYPPGALAASLFQYAGAGHVVIVGPSGFPDRACLRASVVTSELRPLDTVTSGPCAGPVGRDTAIGCLGPTAILLHLDIPAGEVNLPEGGTGFADAVRVQLVADETPDYELLSVRATIEVDQEVEVVIPRFGGTPGDELTFDLGGARAGTCTLTGDLPPSG